MQKRRLLGSAAVLPAAVPRCRAPRAVRAAAERSTQHAARSARRPAAHGAGGSAAQSTLPSAAAACSMSPSQSSRTARTSNSLKLRGTATPDMFAAPAADLTGLLFVFSHSLGCHALASPLSRNRKHDLRSKYCYDCRALIKTALGVEGSVCLQLFLCAARCVCCADCCCWLRVVNQWAIDNAQSACTGSHA